MNTEAPEAQFAELVGLIRSAVAEQQRLLESAVEHYRRSLTNVLTDHSAAVHETRSEGARALHQLELIARSSNSILKKQNEFLEEIRQGMKIEIGAAADEAGRGQAMAFGQAIASSIRAELQAGATRASQAATALENAAAKLRWKTTLASAGIAAGCAFGLILAGLLAWYSYAPRLDDVRELQAEIEHQKAAIAQLADQGGKTLIGPCVARDGRVHRCIATDERLGMLYKDGKMWRVVDGY